MGALRISEAKDLACQLVTEEARMGAAMRKIYLASGSFSAVVSAAQTELRSLAAMVAEEGGDIDGWIG